MKARIFAVGLPLLLAGALPAGATTLSATDILSQFNAVIFGNFTTSADVEGRTVVGGNMTGGATFDLNPISASASSFAGLTVYGNETGTGIYNVNNGGGVQIAGTNAAGFTLNGGGSATIGSGNTGNINTSGGSGAITVGGSNSGTLSAGSGASVFVGGANSAGISVSSGTGSVSVLGANAGNVTLNGGGSVYAGGNSATVSLSNSGAVSLAGSNTGQLTLNGGGTVKIQGNTGNVTLNGGSMTYTGSRNGNVNLNGGATATQSGSVPIATPTNPVAPLPDFNSTFKTSMTALSTQLSGDAANSTTSRVGNALAFNAAPDASGIAVFGINSSLFTANSTVTLNLNGATSVIINVNVDSCQVNVCAFSFPGSVNFTSPTSYADKVLWNFVNATSLTFPNEFGGTVLAPFASITNQGPIDGTVVANSFSGNGELHSHSFSGTLPNGQIVTGPSNSVAVPEPASLALLGTGIAALGALRRRRSRKPL